MQNILRGLSGISVFFVFGFVFGFVFAFFGSFIKKRHCPPDPDGLSTGKARMMPR